MEAPFLFTSRSQVSLATRFIRRFTRLTVKPLGRKLRL